MTLLILKVVFSSPGHSTPVSIYYCPCFGLQPPSGPISKDLLSAGLYVQQLNTNNAIATKG